MRMLAAEYGADLCYSEELIDRRLGACSRVLNDALGTIDFIDSAGVVRPRTLRSTVHSTPPAGCPFPARAVTPPLASRSRGGCPQVVLRTTPLEKHRLVVQIGTANAELALAAASLVARDCLAVDVNMGCPVHFSTSGGMGSALLKKPDTAAEIVKTLASALPCPVTCKIRLLPTLPETVAFAQLMERSGAAAVAVHGRYVPQKPREPAHWDQIAAVVAALRVPVIANGDVFCHSDFERLRADTGAAGAMCARGAQWNASVFREEGLLPAAEVRAAYVAQAMRWANPLSNTKYCLREMLVVDKASGGLNGREGTALNAAKTEAAVAELYGLLHGGCDIGGTAGWKRRGEEAEVEERRPATLQKTADEGD
jgi:tRNA-dihydrouridine synthase 2